MKPEIIILKEGIWQSIASDAFTFLMLVSAIGVGVLIGSSAMQWTGAAFFILSVVIKASSASKKMTIAEARNFLDDLENGGTA